MQKSNQIKDKRSLKPIELGTSKIHNTCHYIHVFVCVCVFMWYIKDGSGLKEMFEKKYEVCDLFEGEISFSKTFDKL